MYTMCLPECISAVWAYAYNDIKVGIENICSGYLFKYL